MIATIVFVCVDLHRNPQHYATPTATLQQVDDPSALADLRMTGWPFVALMETGKTYRITVEEIEPAQPLPNPHQ